MTSSYSAGGRRQASIATRSDRWMASTGRTMTTSPRRPPPPKAASSAFGWAAPEGDGEGIALSATRNALRVAEHRDEIKNGLLLRRTSFVRIGVPHDQPEARIGKDGIRRGGGPRQRDRANGSCAIVGRECPRAAGPDRNGEHGA